MLKQKRIWIPILSVLVIAMGCGLFYGRKVANQEPVTSIKPVEVEKQPVAPKPPPPGETYETGHWHGDEWHSEPHDTHTPAQPQPVEVSEVEVSERSEVPGTPVVTPPIITENGTQMVQFSSELTQEEREFAVVLKKWSDRLSELGEAYSQASLEHQNLMPGTEEELERFENDPELVRKLNEAFAKCGRIKAMLDAHKLEMPVRP